MQGCRMVALQSKRPVLTDVCRWKRLQVASHYEACSLLSCRYRITEGISIPFKVLPTIKELGRTRMEVNLKVSRRT